MTIYRIGLLLTAAFVFFATVAGGWLPYDFFTFLRVLVCGVACWAAFRTQDAFLKFIGLLMIAVLFNPFVRIHLPLPTWRIIDLATAAAFIRLAFNRAGS